MTLPALATVEQLGNVLGRTFDGADRVQAEALLAAASRQVRRYTRQTLTRVDDDVATLIGTDDTRLVLPERPVISVAQVEVLAEDPALTFLAVDWRLVKNTLYRGYGWLGWGGTWPSSRHEINVTYSHGYGGDPDVLDDVIPLPEELADVVIARAVRMLADPGGYLQGETIGAYSYRLDRAADLGLGGGFTEAEQEILDAFKGGGVGTLTVGT